MTVLSLKPSCTGYAATTCHSRHAAFSATVAAAAPSQSARPCPSSTATPHPQHFSSAIHSIRRVCLVGTRKYSTGMLCPYERYFHLVLHLLYSTRCNCCKAPEKAPDPPPPPHTHHTHATATAPQHQRQTPLQCKCPCSKLKHEVREISAEPRPDRASPLSERLCLPPAAAQRIWLCSPPLRISTLTSVSSWIATR